MRALALFHVGDPAVADEVVQDAWVAVLRGIASFEGRSKLSTWIHGIVANLARSRGVREKRTVPFSAFSDDDGGAAVEPERFRTDGGWADPPAPWLRTADVIVADRRACALVTEAIDALPEGQRAVVQLRDVEGMDAADVCAVLGISETNQRVLLHRGRSRLRAVLEHHLGKA